MNPLTTPRDQLLRKAAADLDFARSWVTSQIASEVAAGRSQEDFPMKSLAATVEATRGEMEKRGMYALQGGGNVFYVRWSPRGPIVVQARPFAHRVVRLRREIA